LITFSIRPSNGRPERNERNSEAARVRLGFFADAFDSSEFESVVAVGGGGVGSFASAVACGVLVGVVDSSTPVVARGLRVGVVDSSASAVA
jgi:hypothetical protein